MSHKLSNKVVDELLKLLRKDQEIVLLRRVFRSGCTTYEPLTYLVARMTMAGIPHSEPDVARAKIIRLESPEVATVVPTEVGVQEVNLHDGKVKAHVMRCVLVPERAGIIH